MMRIMLIAAMAATVLVPTMASAQSRHEVRQDRREVRQDRREVRHDVRQGRYHEARRDRRELREDRRERRSDWRDYRRSHRNLYRRGHYVGPRGYRYHRVTIGYRFAPDYYSSRYWINDPWTYRLYRPAANQRWVRYGNDAVLVNLRTGRVLQVYDGFFW